MERVLRRDARGKWVRGSIFRSVFFAYYSAHGCDSARALEVQFIDNTERKDQRGKEKQKESLYNLEFRSFFELKNIGTAISRQEQIRNDSQAAAGTEAAERRVGGNCGALGQKIRANGGCLGYPEARKDVVSCEKARGTANRF